MPCSGKHLRALLKAFKTGGDAAADDAPLSVSPSRAHSYASASGSQATTYRDGKSLSITRVSGASLAAALRPPPAPEAYSGRDQSSLAYLAALQRGAAPPGNPLAITPGLGASARSEWASLGDVTCAERAAADDAPPGRAPAECVLVNNPSYVPVPHGIPASAPERSAPSPLPQHPEGTEEGACSSCGSSGVVNGSREGRRSATASRGGPSRGRGDGSTARTEGGRTWGAGASSSDGTGGSVIINEALSYPAESPSNGDFNDLDTLANFLSKSFALEHPSAEANHIRSADAAGENEGSDGQQRPRRTAGAPGPVGEADEGDDGSKPSASNPSVKFGQTPLRVHHRHKSSNYSRLLDVRVDEWYANWSKSCCHHCAAIIVLPLART